MRLFVAVNPPDRLRRELTTRLDSWRSRLPVAWTRPESWHLTLMFLGEWPENRVPALQEALQSEAARHAPIPVGFSGLGAFPNLNRPRVLFLQADGGAALPELADGVRRCVDAVWPQGPQDHKPFRGHLTLARIKVPLGEADRDLLPQLDPGGWQPEDVSVIRLVSSQLGSGGARHRDLAVLPLAKR